MGKKSNKTTNKTVYGNTTTTNPYVTSQTNNNGTTSCLSNVNVTNANMMYNESPISIPSFVVSSSTVDGLGMTYGNVIGSTFESANNVIGNYFVTGIKIEPKNIFILDYQEQNNIIFNLRNFYNVIDYEFWLVVCDRPVDINLYLAQYPNLFL